MSIHLGMPGYERLAHALMIVGEAFRDNTGRPASMYLVGSSLERRDFRDVDVRLMLSDEQFERLFGDVATVSHNPLHSLLTCAISVYLREQTGLPVDFQIQDHSWANEHHHGTRQPIGRFPFYVQDSAASEDAR